MLAISIQQPWSWAILHAGKDIENRIWSTKIRGRVLIHTGKRIDESGFFDLEDTYNLKPPSNILTGGIVGQCEIIGCVNNSDSKWFYGPWGFQLANAQPLPFFAVRGQLGFFQVQYPYKLIS